MKIENVEDMKEKLYRKGFDTHLNAALDEHLKAGKTEFTLEHFAGIGEDEMGYRLHFRADEDKGKLYLNTIDSALLKDAAAPGQVREHSFPADWLITATEMHRMLKHGLLVSVNKNLFNKEGKPYNTYISIDVNGTKDEYGNYPVKSYHENYFKKEPFVIKDLLQKLPVPVKETENPQRVENMEKSFKKANLIAVTILHNGEETTGKLALNPAERRIDVYDKNMHLIQGQQQGQQLGTPPAGRQQSPEQTQDDVKKKPGQNNRVEWTKNNNPRGMSAKP